MSNLLVAVGGSGNKTLEAFIYMCAAGMGPSAVDVVCIEPDKQNGNFRRTEEILERYRKLHGFFHDGENRLPKDCRLFRTRITNFLAGGLRWSPNDRETPVNNLREVFRASQMTEGGNRALEGKLFDCLFSPEEQETELSKGYRGRPPIGVAALAEAEQQENDPLFTALAEFVKNAKQNEPPSVFFAGSIFGGTGASCVPGLARLICAKEGAATNFMPKGAVFLLPYFAFGSDEEGGLAAESAEFLRQTQGALKYYATALVQQNIFREIFLIGAPALALMPETAKGGGKQKNPPLVVELFASLAACQFLRSKSNDPDTAGNCGIAYKIIDDECISWVDLPYAVAGKQIANDDKPACALGRLVRFSWLMQHVFSGELSEDAKARNFDQPWFKAWLLDTKVEFTDKAQYSVGALKEELNQFCKMFLGWFATIAEPPKNERGIVNAITNDFSSATLFRTGELDQDGYVKCSSVYNEADFNRLVSGVNGYGLERIFFELNGKKPPRKADIGSRFGAFINVLFKTCEVTQVTQ